MTCDRARVRPGSPAVAVRNRGGPVSLLDRDASICNNWCTKIATSAMFSEVIVVATMSDLEAARGTDP
jgi:hypothetical protein